MKGALDIGGRGLRGKPSMLTGLIGHHCASAKGTYRVSESGALWAWASEETSFTASRQKQDGEAGSGVGKAGGGRRSWNVRREPRPGTNVPGADVT